MNIVALIGRFVATPELKQTPSGVSVSAFSLAVNRETKERETDFFDCVAWNKNAEFITRYFNKGDMIGIQGHLQARTWEDKTGQKRKSFEIIVDRSSFVGGKKTDGATETHDDFAVVEDNEDLTF